MSCGGLVCILMWIDGNVESGWSYARIADYFFFFQAEDGIRDVAVTGVQTCALPISYLQNVGTVRDLRDLTRLHDLRDDRQPGTAPRLGQQHQATFAQSLECIGRRADRKSVV